MNDNFCPSHTVVELDTWERGPVFRHFIDDLRCVMSLTVDLEISRFLKRFSASGFRFYPAMIWRCPTCSTPTRSSGTAGTIRAAGPLGPDRALLRPLPPGQGDLCEAGDALLFGPGDLPPPLSGGSDTVRRPGPLRPDGRAAQHL
mgnify:CR=1 FL=1